MCQTQGGKNKQCLGSCSKAPNERIHSKNYLSRENETSKESTQIPAFVLHSFIPLLLTLQQLPVCTDFHIKCQFNIQKLFVVTQLVLHQISYLCYFLLFLEQHFAPVVLFLGQSVLKLVYSILPGSRLESIENISDTKESSPKPPCTQVFQAIWNSKH